MQPPTYTTHHTGHQTGAPKQACARTGSTRRGRGGWRALALLLAAGGWGAASCAPGEGGGEARPARNVLLVVLDTTRADRLGCYGAGPEITPRLDQLASEGVLFQHAYAHAPWTLPSTASLLTSLHPGQHGAGGRLVFDGSGPETSVRPEFRGLHPSIVTLAEVFRTAGWSTAAVVNVEFLSRRFGLMQGFDHVDAYVPATNLDARSAAETTTAALEWLAEEREGRFFLLVHYFDPHAVYAPPPAFRRRFADPVDREDESFVFGTREDMMRLRAGRLDLEPELIERASRLYDGEVAYADREIGRLLDGLDGLGHREDTVVVFTSDHGEEFLDHGGFEHGHTLYDELVRVPLILRAPGVLAPGVVEERVRHVDVAPTVCRLAGVDLHPRFTGRDLLLDRAGDRVVLSHGNFWGPPLTGWISGHHKLVLEPGPDGDQTVRLYDLAADPGERHDLGRDAAHAPLVQELRAELVGYARWEQSRREGSAVELSPEARRRLEELGYLPSGEPGPPGEEAGEREEP